MIKGILTVDNIQEALKAFPKHMDNLIVQEQGGSYYWIEDGKAQEIPQAIGWFIVEAIRVQTEVLALGIPPTITVDELPVISEYDGCGVVV